MAQTILLADDSVTIQKVVELTFMDEDYEVEAVGDGTAAVARLDSRCPDLLIADVHMPGADGYEVCRQAKARYPDLPVLLLVGTFEPFSAAAAQEAGADDHLKKPFDAQDLQKQVEALIAKGAASVPEVAPDLAVAPSAASGAVDDAWELTSATPEVEAPKNPKLDAMPSFSFDDAPTEAISRPAPVEAPAPPVAESPFATALHKTAFPDPMPEFAPEPPKPAFETVHMAHPAVPSPADGDDAGLKEDNLPTQELELGQPLAAMAPPLPVMELEAEEAPIVEPAVLELPVLKPPVLEPPALEPPALEPPALEPPALEPPVLEPPALETLAKELPAEPDAGGLEDAPAEATGAPVAAEEPAAEAAAATPAADRNGSALSDNDVDRIARRVVELLGEGVVREVAWEVVPDLAEVVIKERLRELEDQVG